MPTALHSSQGNFGLAWSSPAPYHRPRCKFTRERSPTVEAGDLKSLKCGFESHRSYCPSHTEVAAATPPARKPAWVPRRGLALGWRVGNSGASSCRFALDDELAFRALGPGLNKREFLRQLAELERQHANRQDNPGSYRCEGCEQCAGCMFCTRCTTCYKCTYCTSCDRCSECTHCHSCTDCHRSAYCVESQNCTGCKYLVYSRDCSDCVYCFGCVGLRGKEFHILNERYDRKTYFEAVAKLEKELNLHSSRR